MGNDYQLITSAAIRTVDNLLCEEDADAADQAKDFLAKYPVGPVPSEQDMGGGEDRLLRGVRVLDKYYLFIWDTYQTTDSHSYLGYRFVAPNGTIIFQGTDFGIPNDIAIDSDDVIYHLLRWFTNEPDEGQLTSEQIEFQKSDDGKNLSSFVFYREMRRAAGQPSVFRDLPGYEHGEDEE